MLNALPTASSLPAPAAPAPAAPRSADGGDGESFSKALNDAAAPEAPAPKAAPAPRARARSTHGANGSDGTDTRRGANASSAGTAADAAQSPTDADGSAADTGTDGHHGDGTVAHPEVCGLLADIQSRHARPPEAPTAPATPATSTAAAEAAEGRSTARTAAHAARAGVHALPAEGGASAGDRRALPMPASARFDPSAAELAPLSLPPERARSAIDTSPTSLPLPTAVAGATGSTAAARAEAHIAAPLGSPDFASQLGASISTFVRDGISHAQLHLNPAEMGPVSVQILLDGQNAQVLLGADQATTRQALEQSLPLLAGSLREAGLTLAGGGVFQQAGHGREGGEQGSGGSPGRRADRDVPQPATLAFTQRRGVVDLVA